MKVCLLITCTLLVSVSLMAVTKMRQAELEKDEKQKTFLDIKLRVTLDLWSEYLRQIEDTNKKTQEIEALEKSEMHGFNVIQGRVGSLKTQVLECVGHQKTSADELATANTELTYRIAENRKEETNWENEKTDLKRQLSQQSLVCDYLKPNSESVRNFCGNKVMGAPTKVEAPQPQVVAPDQRVLK